MNKTHRIVWSAVRQAYVVTHEHATTYGKPAATRAAAVLVAGLLAAAPALAAIDCANSSNIVVSGINSGTCTVSNAPAGEVNITVNEGASIASTGEQFKGDAVVVKNTSADKVQLGKIDNQGALIAQFNSSFSGSAAGLKVEGNVAVSGDIIHNGIINGASDPQKSNELDGISIVSVDAYAPVVVGGVKVGVDGVIHAWGGGNGIEVANFTGSNVKPEVRGGIENAGKIYSGETAIFVQKAIVGHVSNSGELSSKYGIVVSDGQVDGDITNATSGKINSKSGAISIGGWNGSTIVGTLKNEGELSADDGFAVYIAKSKINGGIINKGSIKSVNGIGINAFALTTTNLDNENSITAKSEGIYLTNSNIQGDILNGGTITAGGDGIRLYGYNGGKTVVSGDILNGQDAILKSTGGAALRVENSAINGSIKNAGTIEALNGSGIYLSASNEKRVTVGGDVVNSHIIEAGNGAILLVNADVQGRINNTGRLTSSSEAAIQVQDSELIGGVDNLGIIQGEQTGIVVFDARVGGIRIGGTVTAGLAAIALRSGESGSGTTAGGLTLKGLGADRTANLESPGYAVLALDSGATLGGMTLAGYSKVAGDVYAQNDALTVKGTGNRISGALEVKSLMVEAGGELVLDSLNSTSARSRSASLPSLNNALKTTGGVANNGKLVLAKAETYKVIGNFGQGGGATLGVRVSSNSEYSKLLVTGTATLVDNTTIDVDAAAGLSLGKLEDVIQATGGLTSSGIKVTDNSALFDFSAEKRDNSIDLVIKRAGTGGGSTGGGSTGGDKKPAYLEQIVKDNKGSVPLASADAARVLDKVIDRFAGGNAGAMAPVIDALGKLSSDAGLAQAVEQLTPALPSAALSAVSDSLGAINRVVQARVEGNIGLSSGDEPSAERYVWVKPFGSYAKQDAHSETAGFKANTGGLVFGADAALSPKLRLGAALAYAHSDVDGQSASAPQSSKVDVYQLIGYGSVQLDGNTEFNFQLDAGRNRNQGERRLPFMGLTASSDYDSLSYHLGAGIGRTFALPRAISSTPSLRLDYTRIKEDGYSETGAGAAGLINGKRSVEQTLLAVDNRVTLPLNERQSVALNAGAAYDLMDDGATLTSAFAGEPGAVFSTAAAGQSRWLWRAGLGYTYKADTGKGGLELSTRLDGEWRKGGYSNATASVKARYAF